jgi:hypothetical protein
MRSTRTGYSQILRGMSTSVLMHLQIMRLPHAAFLAYELYDDHEGGSSKEEEKGEERDHAIVPSFAKTHAANKNC